MDVNAGAIITGDRSIREVGDQIFEMILRVASGEQTKSEALGLRDFEIYGPNPLINKTLGIREGF
jgi:altronate hydrolase